MKKLLLAGLIALSTLGAAQAETIYNEQGQEIGHTVSNRYWGTAPNGQRLRVNDAGILSSYPDAMLSGWVFEGQVDANNKKLC
jgi:hypothetical protein